MTNVLKLFTPVAKGYITQIFGVNGDWYRAHGINISGHDGIDFGGCDGYNIRAAHDGVVIYAGGDFYAGVGVEIRSEEILNIGGKLARAKTIYWHMREKSIKVKVGDKVKAGDILGVVGNTGLSTGPHLHFGLKRAIPGPSEDIWYNMDASNGYYGAIDPKPFLNGIAAADAVQFITLTERTIRLIYSLIEMLKSQMK